MKTFENLIEEVQNKGLCHHCGGCVTFCTAINFGALEQDSTGKPCYKDRSKCIECGLCYTICPETHELDDELKNIFSWSLPIGHINTINVARSVDPEIRKRATDGGVVTAILVYLFEKGYIDGAIVSQQIGPFQRVPSLATTKEEIINAAGFNLGMSHGMQSFSHSYSTFSASIEEFRPIMQKGLKRVAMVGSPCQIKAVRKMQLLHLVPTDSIVYYLGLFCAGTFTLGEEEKLKLERLAQCKWEDIKKVNIKDTFILHFNNQEKKFIPLEQIDFMKRYACHFCTDYTSEFADLSFGGVGAEQGWTTILIRNSKGRQVFNEAQRNSLELYPQTDKQTFISEVKDKIQKLAHDKREKALKNRENLLSLQ